jgi:hypothetical protein
MEENRDRRRLFLLFGCVFFFGLDSVDVIVGAEWDDFEVRGDVVYNASLDSVYVKGVSVHECHAAQQKDSSSDWS